MRRKRQWPKLVIHRDGGELQIRVPQADSLRGWLFYAGLPLLLFCFAAVSMRADFRRPPQALLTLLLTLVFAAPVLWVWRALVEREFGEQIVEVSADALRWSCRTRFWKRERVFPAGKIEEISASASPEGAGSVELITGARSYRILDHVAAEDAASVAAAIRFALTRQTGHAG